LPSGRASPSCDGNDLLIEARAEPPSMLVKALTCHKGSIVSLLRECDEARSLSGADRKQGCRTALPGQWADGFAALAVGPPLDGYTPKEWHQLIEDAEHFLDDWAQEAARQGWSVLDAFGVHVRAPAARYDGMGLVPLIRGGKIVALTGDHATIRMPSGSELTVLRRPLQDAVPIWTVAPGTHAAGELEPASDRSAELSTTPGEGDDGE
jgi:hypothetical protein